MKRNTIFLLNMRLEDKKYCFSNETNNLIIAIIIITIIYNFKNALTA